MKSACILRGVIHPKNLKVHEVREDGSGWFDSLEVGELENTRNSFFLQF